MWPSGWDDEVNPPRVSELESVARRCAELGDWQEFRKVAAERLSDSFHDGYDKGAWSAQCDD